MKLVTATQLATYLENYIGASFISCVTATEPTMNVKNRETKKANPYLGRVKRMAIRTGMIGASYENAVNNRRLAEDHPAALAGQRFNADELWKGAGESLGGALVRHKPTGRLYMAFYPRHDDDGGVITLQSEWLCDGAPIEKSELVPYLPPVKEGSPRQETERAVPWRVIALDSIVSLTVQGETFTIIR